MKEAINKIKEGIGKYQRLYEKQIDEANCLKPKDCVEYEAYEGARDYLFGEARKTKGILEGLRIALKILEDE